MSLIYKHWKTVVTVHVSTSKMHDFHILDSRAGQEVREKEKKKKLYFLTLGGKPSTNYHRCAKSDVLCS